MHYNTIIRFEDTTVVTNQFQVLRSGYNHNKDFYNIKRGNLIRTPVCSSV